jgi:hypothetical protein
MNCCLFSASCGYNPGMTRREGGTRNWQFSLRAVFGLCTLVGIGIWVLHDNLRLLFATLLLAPFLAAAIGLEFAGHSEIAMLVGAVTGVVWLMLVVW